MHTMDIAGAPAANHIFTPDMTWTRDIPAARTLDCVAAAEEMFAQAERKLGQVERTGLDRGQIRVAAFLPACPMPVSIAVRAGMRVIWVRNFGSTVWTFEWKKPTVPMLWNCS